jgi:hypothetical protein
MFSNVKLPSVFTATVAPPESPPTSETVRVTPEDSLGTLRTEPLTVTPPDRCGDWGACAAAVTRKKNSAIGRNRLMAFLGLSANEIWAQFYPAETTLRQRF